MKSLGRIFSYARELWPYYVGSIVFSILMSATGILQAFISKNAVDVVTVSVANHSANVNGAIFWAAMFLLADLANTLFTNWGGYLGDVMSAKLRTTLSVRYYDQLLNLSQRYYDNELTGKIINRLNRTITEVTNFINMFANNFFQMLLTIVAILGILLFYSWELALLVFIIYPLFMWLTTKTSNKWQVWQKEKNDLTDIASGRFAEVIGSIKVVKSFVRERSELTQFSRDYTKTITLTQKQSKYWHDMDVMRRSILSGIFFLIYAFIFAETALGRFSLGEMVMLIQLVTMVRMPIFSMSFLVDNTQKAIAGSIDYFSVMEEVADVREKPNAQRLRVRDAKVEFRNVSFGYTADNPVLHNVSFTIEPGTKLALVGKSGEGKTTISNLLLRLYDTTDGDVMIDGMPIRSVTSRSLHEQIGVVFQEPTLYSGSIRENILYGKPSATEAEIVAAAKAANAYDFICKFDKGFDTEIGERGLKLSGGQKQRIAIARAILKDAPILILDEATSSLDSKAEHEVQEALDRLMKQRTTLIIAHRLSTIAGVDAIVTLRDGRVDEIGRPTDLAHTGGIYAELLDLQLRATERDKKRLANYEITS